MDWACIQKASAEQGLLAGASLPAFPALIAGDHLATRQLRVDSCQSVWGQVSAAVQVSALLNVKVRVATLSSGTALPQVSYAGSLWYVHLLPI